MPGWAVAVWSPMALRSATIARQASSPTTPAAAGGGGGAAVAAVVGGDDGIAVAGQEACEAVVAAAVFGGAVGDLHEGARAAGLREPGVGGDAGAVGGLVEVLLHGLHGLVS